MSHVAYSANWGGLPFKIMYFFTDGSDKMPFQVMKNDQVAIVQIHLGPRWLQIEDDEGWALCCQL